tara:strand:- start:96 stop:413 length:318 start_codon:yes stop_codon:yes gene_type:complete
MASASVEKQVRMGLGQAIRRLFHLEVVYRQGQRTEELTTERLLLLEALNRIEIDLGFDCDDDGVPDTVEIFQKTASTSCCRILPAGGKAKSERVGGKKARRVRKK